MFIQLEPAKPYFQPQPETVEKTDTQQPALTIRDSGPVGKLYLRQFPDYTFDEEGQPYRITHKVVGPKPPLGKVKPTRVSKRNRFFTLSTTTGRITITDTRIKEMLSGRAISPTDYFSIDDFPNNYFDNSGTAYQLKSRQPCKSQPLQTGERTIRRYRLYSESRKAYVWFTDIAARRYHDGRCSLTTAVIPDDCVALGDDFPDWCCDIYTGQPYRVASRRFAVYQPTKLAARSDGSFYISQYDGSRIRFMSDDLLKLINSPYAKQ